MGYTIFVIVARFLAILGFESLGKLKSILQFTSYSRINLVKNGCIS